MKIDDFVGMLSGREVKALLKEFDQPPDIEKGLVSVRGYLVAPYRRRIAIRTRKALTRNKKHID